MSGGARRDGSFAGILKNCGSVLEIRPLPEAAALVGTATNETY
jgi:hypothetical protein